MRVSRLILVCACAAIGVVIATVWFATPREGTLTPLAPQSVEEVERGHRESAVLASEPKPTASSTREAPPAPGIHGRLTERTTGAPLAGWTIQLQHPNEPAQFAVHPGDVVESSGDVTFPFPKNRRLTLSENQYAALWQGSVGELQPKTFRIEATQPITPSAHAGTDALTVSDDLAKQVQAAARWVQPQQNSTEPAPNSVDPGMPNEPEPTSSALYEIDVSPTTEVTLPVIVPTVVDTPSTSNDGVLRPSNEQIRTKIIPVIEAGIQQRNADAMSQQLQLSFILAQGSESRLHVAQFKTWPPPVPDEPLASRTQAECVTDADGRFDLPCPDEDGAWLQLVPQAPLHPDSPRYPLHAAADACARPIEWKTHIVERSIAHVLVLDAATNEPVPFLSVTLSDEVRKEVCTTDENGRCTTTKAFATGRVRATFEDGPAQPRAIGSDEPELEQPVHCEQDSAILSTAGDDLVFRVAIGPTLRFAWLAGPEPKSAFARIHGIVAQDHADQDELGAGWSRLRTEFGWFLRLPVPVQSLPHGTPAVDLWTDGMQLARVEPKKLVGRIDLIEVTTHLGAQAHGRVMFDEDHLILGARVSLIDGAGNELDATTSGAEGVWNLSGIDPARVSWVQVDFDGVSKRTSVPFHAGENHEIDLTLGARPH